MFILKISLGSINWIKIVATKNPLPITSNIWKATNYFLSQEHLLFRHEFLPLSHEEVEIHYFPLISKLL